MELIAGALVFSPTDLNNFFDCEYLTQLDVAAAHGLLPIERHRGAQADLLARKGEAHEQAWLARFEQQQRVVTRIASPRGAWADAARETQRAMAAGADVIYQGVLLSDGWRGKADFLVRVAAPSAFGTWSYEAWDTKLARHAKPSHVLQLAYYSECVAAVQRLEPEWMTVVLGTGEPVRLRYRDFSAYFRVVQRRFVRSVLDSADVQPYPGGHCGLCGYEQHCEELWELSDHLSRVAGIRRSQVEALVDEGISTCAALATTAGDVGGIGGVALARLRHQAALQTHFRQTGSHRYELLLPGDENGFLLLPAASEGDIFFDMEGFPFFDDEGGLEYLFGAVTDDGGKSQFHSFRATDRTSEKVAFERFVDFVWDRLRRWPDLHVYHYAQYEPAALKRLMTVHATREDEVDELLRRDAFVDLYQVVRRAMRISHDNYSIKAVRQFFMPDAGHGDVTDGGESIVEFQRWLDTGDQRILDAIERYNEEDCISTERLRDWLLERRLEARREFGIELPFRSVPDRRTEPLETEPDGHAALRARLDAIGEPWTRTLGQLLDYHRREAKPEWWAYFERRKKSLDDLLDDTEAIAYLTPADKPPQRVKQSMIWTLEYPNQEFKLKPDANVDGPFDEGRAGTIEWIDAARGRLGLRRGPRLHAVPLPRAILAGGPVPDAAQRRAVERVAEAVAAGQRRYLAVEAILRRDAPRFSRSRRRIQTLDLDAQKRLVDDLQSSYLFVQGPPGSGKTWTGARLVLDLLRSGKRVGVTGPSHRAIHNLLEEIERVAMAERVVFTGVKKRGNSEETVFDGTFIHTVSSNEEAETSGAQLVAGTAWLFAREPMEHAFDYLFIDEAGQFALADAVAVGSCAHNIVLLGDPQQLPHVTQNTHPDGSGASVLEHLLGDAATVAEDRGLFLAKSWRMHPDVCRFISELSYDARLTSAAGCDLQNVRSAGLTGNGLRYIAVDHRNNSQQSPEEAGRIANEIDLLLAGAQVTDREGATRRLSAADILVVAPFNMQVRCLRDALPNGVEVGTVDKFQGREAAVVFFSMTSSSGDDVPRGLEFLFNRNRFNVAVSRAKCLSVVVSSPRLLESPCRTVEQMALVNAVCRFAEESARQSHKTSARPRCS